MFGTPSLPSALTPSGHVVELSRPHSPPVRHPQVMIGSPSVPQRGNEHPGCLVRGALRERGNAETMMATFNGTDFKDFIDTFFYDDLVPGYTGELSDAVDGYDGDDVIDGYEGHDGALCGFGHDTIYGGSGDDDLSLRTTPTTSAAVTAQTTYTAARAMMISMADPPATTFRWYGRRPPVGGAGRDTLAGGAGEDVFSSRRAIPEAHHHHGRRNHRLKRSGDA